MNMRELASYVCKKEGKKLQEHIGNVREVLSILSDMVWLDLEVSHGSINKGSVVHTLYNNGKRRSKRKKVSKSVSKRVAIQKKSNSKK